MNNNPSKETFCPKCGHLFLETDSFCTNCGNKRSDWISKEENQPSKKMKSKNLKHMIYLYRFVAFFSLLLGPFCYLMALFLAPSGFSWIARDLVYYSLANRFLTFSFIMILINLIILICHYKEKDTDSFEICTLSNYISIIIGFLLLALTILPIYVSVISIVIFVLFLIIFFFRLAKKKPYGFYKKYLIFTIVLAFLVAIYSLLWPRFIFLIRH